MIPVLDDISMVDSRIFAKGLVVKAYALNGSGVFTQFISEYVGSTLFVDGYGVGSPPNHSIGFRSARGTEAAPTAVQANDRLGGINFRGYGTTAFAAVASSAFVAFAAENWTDTVRGTYLIMSTTKIGTSTPASVLRINDDSAVVAYTNFSYLAEVDNGSPSTTATVSFATGSLQKLTVAGSLAITLVPTAYPGYVQLRLIAGVGASQPTWNTPVNWFEASVAPTISVVSGKNTILSFYWDGAAWYGSGGRFGL